MTIGVSTSCLDGKKIRVLAIVDTLTRLSPAVDVRQNHCRCDGVETLERVSVKIGDPKTLRLDTPWVYRQGA